MYVFNTHRYVYLLTDNSAFKIYIYILVHPLMPIYYSANLIYMENKDLMIFIFLALVDITDLL